MRLRKYVMFATTFLPLVPGIDMRNFNGRQIFELLEPFTTLLNIYQSLILPYLTYGLAAWGQAAKTHLQKILVLQKRAIRLMYLSCCAFIYFLE